MAIGITVFRQLGIGIGIWFGFDAMNTVVGEGSDTRWVW